MSSKPLQRTLINLCSSGDVADVKSFLANKCTPEFLTEPLLCACEAGRLDVVEALLDVGHADVDLYVSLPALFVACKRGHLDLVKCLVNHRANVNVRVDLANGSTPLYVACQENRVEIVRYLLECTPASANIYTLDGISPLTIACNRGFTGVVELLLEKGKVDVNHSNSAALRLACNWQHSEVLSLLLEKGHADVDAYFDSSTCLHKACDLRYTKVVKILIDTGHANVNAQGTSGETPLFVACKQNFEDIADILLCSHADPDIPLKQCGTTPLIFCCQFGRIGMVKLLVEKGHADIYKTDLKGVSPIYATKRTVGRCFYSSTSVRTEIIRLLQRGLLAFLCAHHPRCGAASILQQLPPSVMIDIAKLLPH